MLRRLYTMDSWDSPECNTCLLPALLRVIIQCRTRCWHVSAKNKWETTVAYLTSYLAPCDHQMSCDWSTGRVFSASLGRLPQATESPVLCNEALCYMHTLWVYGTKILYHQPLNYAYHSVINHGKNIFAFCVSNTIQINVVEKNLCSCFNLRYELKLFQY